MCGTISDRYVTIDAKIRESLGDSGASLPDSICATCFEQVTSTVSQGLKLRMERDVREKNKMMMWSSRVSLVKNARSLMDQKAYSDAAVQLEKYLRVLEVVYNLNKGELSPKVFNNSTRSKELTIVASVYWDLVRIYDTSPRYGNRMAIAAAKLSEFLPFSTIYPDIVRKAETFARTCKNPNVMRSFLRATKRRRGPCFIATAAFAENPEAVELYWLRQFRDQCLRQHIWGRQVIWVYYRISPSLARRLDPQAWPTHVARWALTKMTHALTKRLKTSPRIDELGNYESNG